MGLHTPGAEVEELAEIARKHGLTYQLAIDRPNEKDKYNLGRHLTHSVFEPFPGLQ